MAEAEINIEKVFKNMMFGKNVTECGYFPERQAENILTYFDWLDKMTGWIKVCLLKNLTALFMKGFSVRAFAATLPWPIIPAARIAVSVFLSESL